MQPQPGMFIYKLYAYNTNMSCVLYKQIQEQNILTSKIKNKFIKI